jgi:hypothetical protein
MSRLALASENTNSALKIRGALEGRLRRTGPNRTFLAGSLRDSGSSRSQRLAAAWAGTSSARGPNGQREGYTPKRTAPHRCGLHQQGMARSMARSRFSGLRSLSVRGAETVAISGGFPGVGEGSRTRDLRDHNSRSGSSDLPKCNRVRDLADRRTRPTAAIRARMARLDTQRCQTKWPPRSRYLPVSASSRGTQRPTSIGRRSGFPWRAPTPRHLDAELSEA